MGFIISGILPKLYPFEYGLIFFEKHTCNVRDHYNISNRKAITEIGKLSDCLWKSFSSNRKLKQIMKQNMSMFLQIITSFQGRWEFTATLKHVSFQHAFNVRSWAKWRNKSSTQEPFSQHNM